MVWHPTPTWLSVIWRFNSTSPILAHLCESALWLWLFVSQQGQDNHSWVHVCVSAGTESWPNTQQLQDRKWSSDPCVESWFWNTLMQTNTCAHAHTYTRTCKWTEITHPSNTHVVSRGGIPQKDVCYIGCIVDCKLALVKKYHVAPERGLRETDSPSGRTATSPYGFMGKVWMRWCKRRKEAWK